MPSKKRPPTPGSSAVNSPRISFAKTIAEARQNYPQAGLPSLPNAVGDPSTSGLTPLPTLPPPKDRTARSKRRHADFSLTFSSPLAPDESISKHSKSALNISSVAVENTGSTSVTTTKLTATGLAPLPSLPNLASSAASGLPGPTSSSTARRRAATATKAGPDSQLSGSVHDDGERAVVEETMRSLWKAKSPPQTPREPAGGQLSPSSNVSSPTSSSTPPTSAGTSPHSSKSPMVSPTNLTKSIRKSKSPFSTAGSSKFFKPSLATPMPPESAPPIIPSTPLPSKAARSPPPAPLNLSKSLPGAMSSIVASSTVSGSTQTPPFTPSHRRDGSFTQYAQYPPPPATAPVPGMAGFSSTSTPNLPASSITATCPATVIADQSSLPSPTTPQRKLSLKRLLSKPAPASPNTSPPADNGTPIEERRAKSLEESRHRETTKLKRKPSIVAVDSSESDRKDAHALKTKPKSRDRMRLKADSSSNNEQSQSSSTSTPTPYASRSRPPLPHWMPSGSSLSLGHVEGSSPSEREDRIDRPRRTSSDHDQKKRNGSRARREASSPLSSLHPPVEHRAENHTQEPIWSRVDDLVAISAGAKPKVALSAVQVGHQFAALEYEPPSPSLDISAALSSLEVHTSTPVTREASIRNPPFDMDFQEITVPADEINHSGMRSTTSSSTPMATSTPSGSARTGRFEGIMPKYEHFASAPATPSATHGGKHSALVADVECALSGLGPRRQHSKRDGKERKVRGNLLRKASRKFGGDKVAADDVLVSKSTSKISPSLPSATTSGFCSPLPTPLSLEVPNRSRSTSRDTRRQSLGRVPTTLSTRTSNPASRSSSVSRDVPAQRPKPSNWQTPAEWLSPPQSSWIQSPPTTSSTLANKPAPLPIQGSLPSAPGRRASLRVPQSVDDKSFPSLSLSTPPSRAPSRLAESTAPTDIQSAVTNAISSTGTGTSGADGSLVFIPMMLVEDNCDGGLGSGRKTQTARLSVMAGDDKREKKKRKDMNEPRPGANRKLTPAASLIEEWKTKEMERNKEKAKARSQQGSPLLVKDRRSRSLVGLRDMFFGGDDRTNSIAKPVDLSLYIQPSPRSSSHRTINSKDTHPQNLLRHSGGLASSMSESNLRGSFIAGESVRISGYGGSHLRAGQDQIRMMFAGGAIERGEDGGGAIDDDDYLSPEPHRERDPQPSTPHRSRFGISPRTERRDIGDNVPARDSDGQAGEKRKEGLTKTLSRKVSISKWTKGNVGRNGYAPPESSEDGHANTRGYVSEREPRSDEKADPTRRRRVNSAKRHELDRPSLRVSTDKSSDGHESGRLRRSNSERAHPPSPTRNNTSLWRLMRSFSISVKEKSSIPPPPVPALPEMLPSEPPKKKRSRSRKGAARPSSPISTSDHASSSNHRAQSARSSTSSILETPPPLPKPPSGLLSTHIITPGMLDTIHPSETPRFQSPYMNMHLVVENDWTPAYAHSSEPDVGSLTIPPRRLSTKPVTKPPNVVSANTPRASPISSGLEPPPRLDTDNESTRSASSNSPIIPTFSTNDPINTFPKRLSSSLSNQSKGSPITPLSGAPSSPLDVNGDPVFSNSPTFIFPPPSLSTGAPPRPTRNPHRPSTNPDPSRPRIHPADVPVDVKSFSSESTSVSPTSPVQKFAPSNNPTKFLYRKSSGGLSVGSAVPRGLQSVVSTPSHSRKRSSSYCGGNSSDGSSPLSQSPTYGYPIKGLAPSHHLVKPSTPPDSFSRYATNSVHRPGTSNTFGPSSTLHRGQPVERVMTIFDMHPSLSTSSIHSSSTANTTQDVNSRRRSPMPLSPSVSSLRSSILLDSETYGVFGGSTVQKAQRVVLSGRDNQ